MQNIILFFFFCFSGYSFSQQDPIPEKKYEAFFGCACCGDTIVKSAGDKTIYELVLYKPTRILTGSKHGKITWTIDLKDVLANQDLTYLCLYPGFGKKGERILLCTGSKILAEIFVKNGKIAKNRTPID